MDGVYFCCRFMTHPSYVDCRNISGGIYCSAKRVCGLATAERALRETAKRQEGCLANINETLSNIGKALSRPISRSNVAPRTGIADLSHPSVDAALTFSEVWADCARKGVIKCDSICTCETVLFGVSLMCWGIFVYTSSSSQHSCAFQI